VRARIEHSIGIIKRVFGFAKVRYRGWRVSMLTYSLTTSMPFGTLVEPEVKVVIRRDWYSLRRRPLARAVMVTSTSNRTITGSPSLHGASLRDDLSGRINTISWFTNNALVFRG
jgi:hypothetical protein